VPDAVELDSCSDPGLFIVLTCWALSSDVWM